MIASPLVLDGRKDRPVAPVPDDDLFELGQELVNTVANESSSPVRLGPRHWRAGDEAALKPVRRTASARVAEKPGD